MNLVGWNYVGLRCTILYNTLTVCCFVCSPAHVVFQTFKFFWNNNSLKEAFAVTSLTSNASVSPPGFCTRSRSNRVLGLPSRSVGRCCWVSRPFPRWNQSHSRRGSIRSLTRPGWPSASSWWAPCLCIPWPPCPCCPGSWQRCAGSAGSPPKRNLVPSKSGFVSRPLDWNVNRSQRRLTSGIRWSVPASSSVSLSTLTNWSTTVTTRATSPVWLRTMRPVGGVSATCSKLMIKQK